MTHLPGILGQIEQAAGRAVAEGFARRYGGLRVYLPQRPRAGQKLVEEFGLAAIEAIVRDVGWGEIEVPAAGFRGRMSARRRAREALERGASLDQAAREADCCLSTVVKTRRAMRAEDDLPLLDWKKGVGR